MRELVKGLEHEIQCFGKAMSKDESDVAIEFARRWSESPAMREWNPPVTILASMIAAYSALQATILALEDGEEETKDEAERE
jgi:hypothetical protein